MYFQVGEQDQDSRHTAHISLVRQHCRGSDYNCLKAIFRRLPSKYILSQSFSELVDLVKINVQRNKH